MASGIKRKYLIALIGFNLREVIKSTLMYRFYIVCMLVVFIACGDSGEERTDGYSNIATSPEDSLMEAVMEAHNVAMAKKGKVTGYLKTADQKIDSVSKIRSGDARQTEAAYRDVRSKLKVAEDGMNKWMNEFRADSAQNETDVRISYLTEEKRKMEQIRDQTLEALKQADSVLGK
jgi:hypothetical protein